MLGIGIIDWEDRRVFAKRTSACSKILNEMNPQDRMEFDKALLARRQQGNPVNIQVA